MFVKLTQKTDLLNIPSNFAALRKVDKEGNLYFELTYSVSSKKVLKQNALIVRVSMYVETVRPKELTESSKNLSNKALVNDILNYIPARATAVPTAS